MDKPIELVPLRCTKCQAPVPANAGEVAWVCAQCAQGLLLNEESGLVPLEVNYANSISPDSIGKPFWVVSSKVELVRDAYDRSNEMEIAQLFWGEPRRFFIPAYTCPMETALTLGTQYLVNPPILLPGNPISFEAVTLALKDMQALVEFTVLAVEAERSDQLRKVEINLELDIPALWILP